MILRETKRVLYYLLIITFYLTSEVGMVIGITHFFLGLAFPKYSMSRVVMAMVDVRKRKFDLKKDRS